MLETYAINGEITKAFGVLRKMQKEDTKPTTETYTILYDALAKKGDVLGMKELAEEIIKTSRGKSEDGLKEKIQNFLQQHGESIEWKKKKGS